MRRFSSVFVVLIFLFCACSPALAPSPTATAISSPTLPLPYSMPAMTATEMATATPFPTRIPFDTPTPELLSATCLDQNSIHNVSDEYLHKTGYTNIEDAKKAFRDRHPKTFGYSASSKTSKSSLFQFVIDATLMGAFEMSDSTLSMPNKWHCLVLMMPTTTMALKNDDLLIIAVITDGQVQDTFYKMDSFYPKDTNKRTFISVDTFERSAKWHSDMIGKDMVVVFPIYDFADFIKVSNSNQVLTSNIGVMGNMPEYLQKLGKNPAGIKGITQGGGGLIKIQDLIDLAQKISPLHFKGLLLRMIVPECLNGSPPYNCEP